MLGQKLENGNCEIESLNLDNLDVEELERRLEMSTDAGIGLDCDLEVCLINVY
jgi:hypothetical protein